MLVAVVVVVVVVVVMVVVVVVVVGCGLPAVLEVAVSRRFAGAEMTARRHERHGKIHFDE